FFPVCCLGWFILRRFGFFPLSSLGGLVVGCFGWILFVVGRRLGWVVFPCWWLSWVCVFRLVVVITAACCQQCDEGRSAETNQRRPLQERTPVQSRLNDLFEYEFWFSLGSHVFSSASNASTRHVGLEPGFRSSAA